MDPLRRCLAGLWGMVVRKCGMDAGGIFRERDTRILSEVVRLSNWRIANGREAGQSKPLKSVPSCVWVSFSTSWGTGQETRIPPPTNPPPTPSAAVGPIDKREKEKKEKKRKRKKKIVGLFCVVEFEYWKQWHPREPLLLSGHFGRVSATFQPRYIKYKRS